MSSLVPSSTLGAQRVVTSCGAARVAIALLLGLAAGACHDVRAAPPGASPGAMPTVAPAPAAGQAVAVFAGGCFWCMEADFEKLPGVVSATSGYAGGAERSPTYEQVSSGRTGHTESVRVVYDPAKLSYETLADFFFKHIDPTQANGQFCDLGRQYRTAVFVANDVERQAVDKLIAGYAAQRLLPGRVVTEIVPATTFWPAEEYHQDYARKEPSHYGRYRAGCGRDDQVRAVWGARK